MTIIHIQNFCYATALEDCRNKCCLNPLQKQPSRGAPRGKSVLKIYSKFAAEHTCHGVISIKSQSNFIEITLWHLCSLTNLLYILRTPFPKKTSGGLLPTLYLLINKWVNKQQKRKEYATDLQNLAIKYGSTWRQHYSCKPYKAFLGSLKASLFQFFFKAKRVSVSLISVETISQIFSPIEWGNFTSIRYSYDKRDYKDISLHYMQL